MLGVDIGGVLVDRVAEGEDTSFFGNRPMETPAVPGCHDAVGELVRLFEHRVHIVSKAGPRVSAASRKWLSLQALVGADAVDPANLHFVRKRPEKHPICERLGVTHFVDDRLDVLSALVTVEHRFLFVGGLGLHRRPESVPAYVTVTSTWPETVAAIVATLRPV